MAKSKVRGIRIAGIATSVPARIFNNIEEKTEFSVEEVRKVVGLAGVSCRRVASPTMCSSDLCLAAAQRILDRLAWKPESIDALIMVTQSPDYLLPSTACIIQQDLGLSDECAVFDVGLGCSGYPYGLWLAAMMLNSGGLRRVLVLHGETPTRFSDKSDRSVYLLFGDSGSATALEAAGTSESKPWFFQLNSDGSGFADMIIEAGGFRNRVSDDPQKYCVRMNGANIFNFTIKRVPELIKATHLLSQTGISDIDYYIFHQSNHFIIKHLINKLKIPSDKVPIILKDFGNTGGPSVPLTITQGDLKRPTDRSLSLMLLGYGVGLSWGAALVDLDAEAIFDHVEL
jgi:3-oxoacyl-[acyl-carrier-protein] synthase-3